MDRWILCSAVSSIFCCRRYTVVSGQCLLGKRASNLFMPYLFSCCNIFYQYLSSFDIIFFYILCVFFCKQTLTSHPCKLSVCNLDDRLNFRFRLLDCSSSSSRVGFNIPPNTLYVISGTVFTGHVTQPTVSSTEGQQLVSPPGKGPISPDQALYKVK